MALSFYLYDSVALMTSEGEKLLLAESVTPNETADQWTIKLKDAKFSNGDDVTGTDLIASLEHLSVVPSFQEMYGNIDFDKSSADGSTVFLAMKEPASDFLVSSLAMFSPVAPNGEFDGVGAGPFSFVKGDPTTGYTLEANESYYGGKPAIPSVVMKSIPDSDSRARALRTGEIDYAWGLEPASMKILKESEGIALPSGSLEGATIKELVLNTRVAPFNDPEVRRAAKLTVDRQKMVTTLLGDQGVVGNDLVGMGYPTYPVNIEQTTVNKDEARRIFAEKGVTQFTVVASDVAPGLVASAELMAQEFKQVGLEMKIETVDPQSFFSQMPSLYETSAFTFYWINRMPLTNLKSQTSATSLYNVSGYTSDTLQSNLDKASATVDEKEQEQLVADISSEVHAQGGDLIWGYQKETLAYREGLDGVVITQSMPWIAEATFTPVS